MFEFDTPSAISPEEYAQFLDSGKAEREAHAVTKAALKRQEEGWIGMSSEWTLACAKVAELKAELAVVKDSLRVAGKRIAAALEYVDRFYALDETNIDNLRAILETE